MTFINFSVTGFPSFSFMSRSASNRENTSFSSFCATVIQKSLSLCPWCSRLHFGYHQCQPCQPMMLCISVSALGRNTATCIFLTPAWGSVPWVLTHTVSIFIHHFSPQFLVFVFYVTNFLYNFYKCSYHCLSMPCVSSLLSLSGLTLAPPSGPSATVIGQSTWQLSWHKKPKKIERSPLTSHHPAKRNTNKHKSHKHNPI